MARTSTSATRVWPILARNVRWLLQRGLLRAIQELVVEFFERELLLITGGTAEHGQFLAQIPEPQARVNAR